MILPSMKNYARKGLFAVALAMALAHGAMSMNASDGDLAALKLVASRRPLVIGYRRYCQVEAENPLP